MQLRGGDDIKTANRGASRRISVEIIGISNDFKFRDKLDPRVQDTLCERELQFPPYDAPELESILFLRAEIALQDDADTITEDRVAAAKMEFERERVEEGIRQLTQHGHLALLAIVSLTAADRTPVRTRVVYRRYQNVCKTTATEPLAQRSLHNHLQVLVMLGILNQRENRSGSRGNYHTYELDVLFESSLSALEEKIDVGEQFDDLRGLADANGVA